jgi:hypothetical protein
MHKGQILSTKDVFMGYPNRPGYLAPYKGEVPGAGLAERSCSKWATRNV